MHKITTHLVGTSDLNRYGKLYGGKVLSLLDTAGWELILSKLKSRGQVVTKAVKEVLFESPIDVGDTIEIYGNIEQIGSSSATVKLEVIVKDKKVITATIVYVHLLEGKPSPIISV